jgi:hypothetical protein
MPFIVEYNSSFVLSFFIPFFVSLLMTLFYVAGHIFVGATGFIPDIVLPWQIFSTNGPANYE